LEKLQEYIMMTNGKAFVLFTSHAMLRSCADRLQGFFLEKGINLLVHDRALNRTELLKEFKEDVNSVLFGTDSFWTGVDVPGEALSNVIVAKLPFAVPSHPLIKARCERIEAAGGKAFMDYSLPEAILKFRQGVGRLVRSKTDTGYIVLLDRRITSKFYGRWFLDSLPPHPIKYV
jgi:ATP-dependent DNA helicase DinG